MNRLARPRSNTRRTAGSARKFVRSASSPIFSASPCTLATARANVWYACSLSPQDAYTSPSATWICHSSPGSPISLARTAASCKDAIASLPAAYFMILGPIVLPLEGVLASRVLLMSRVFTMLRRGG